MGEVLEGIDELISLVWYYKTSYTYPWNQYNIRYYIEAFAEIDWYLLYYYKEKHNNE